MRRVAFVTVLSCALGVSAGASAGQGDLPDVHSRAAAVIDLDTGAEVFTKGADDSRAIASTTKIFVALAVRKKGLDLDGWTEITRADVDAARGGAKTRLDRGQSFRNIDLLRAMLMASDNRAPTALGRAAGLDPKQLIAAMNSVAKDLGLKKTRFTDTSGLHGNVSTAREMALALRAALADDVIRAVMGTDSVIVKSRSGYEKIRYGNTDQALGSKWKVLGGKTGYTESAGYCFIVGAEIAGRPLVMAFLGADGKATRFADFSRVADWIDRGAPGAKVKVAAKPVRDKPRLSVSARGHAEE
jgi:D-alanyl-D-alanine endopeptidase (penicillin-binding protein 7)